MPNPLARSAGLTATDLIVPCSMPGPTGSQVRPRSWLRKRPAPAVPQYTRVGSRASTATQSGDRPPKCSSTVQVEARRAINRAVRVTTTMPTMTESPPVCGSALYDPTIRLSPLLLQRPSKHIAERLGRPTAKALDVAGHNLECIRRRDFGRPFLNHLVFVRRTARHSRRHGLVEEGHREVAEIEKPGFDSLAFPKLVKNPLRRLLGK